MAERLINIQDAFLNYIRKNKVSVTVFLLNGVKLNGVISCFDQATIVIKRDGYTQLVYKHAISTFSPHGPISVFDWNGPQQSAPVQSNTTTTEYDNREIDEEEDGEEYDFSDEDYDDDDE